MLAALAVLVSSLAPAGIVFADPAGPTDYRSEIIDIDPPTPDIAVAIT